MLISYVAVGEDTTFPCTVSHPEAISRTMYMNSGKKCACIKDERGKLRLAIMPANFMHINIIRKSVLFVIILVISCFGFEGWSWVLIASVPDLCILLTFIPSP